MLNDANSEICEVVRVCVTGSYASDEKLGHSATTETCSVRLLRHVFFIDTHLLNFTLVPQICRNSDRIYNHNTATEKQELHASSGRFALAAKSLCGKKSKVKQLRCFLSFLKECEDFTSKC